MTKSTIEDVIEDWEYITDFKKVRAIEALYRFFAIAATTGLTEEDNAVLYDILYSATLIEQDDYFGTEGLKV